MVATQTRMNRGRYNFCLLLTWLILPLLCGDGAAAASNVSFFAPGKARFSYLTCLPFHNDSERHEFNYLVHDIPHLLDQRFMAHDTIIKGNRRLLVLPYQKSYWSTFLLAEPGKREELVKAHLSRFARLAVHPGSYRQLKSWSLKGYNEQMNARFFLSGSFILEDLQLTIFYQLYDSHEGNVVFSGQVAEPKYDVEVHLKKIYDRIHRFLTYGEAKSVVIHSDQDNVRVYIDNRFIGKTPAKALIPYGFHTLELNSEDIVPRKTMINIRETTPPLLTFSLKKRPYVGPLVIETDPAGASVYLDVVKRGTTPLRMEKVIDKKYRLKIKKPGYRTIYRQVDVGALGGEPVRYALKPMPVRPVKPAPWQDQLVLWRERPMAERPLPDLDVAAVAADPFFSRYPGTGADVSYLRDLRRLNSKRYLDDSIFYFSFSLASFAGGFLSSFLSEYRIHQYLNSYGTEMAYLDSALLWSGGSLVLWGTSAVFLSVAAVNFVAYLNNEDVKIGFRVQPGRWVPKVTTLTWEVRF